MLDDEDDLDDSDDLTESEDPDESDLHPDSDDDEDADVDDDAVDTHPCPHCGQPIYEHAETCPHCRQSISPSDLTGKKPLWFIIAVLICLAIILIVWVSIRGG